MKSAQKTQPSFNQNALVFLLTLLAIAAIVSFDIYLGTEITIAPLGLTVLLTVLSLYLRPVPLALWIIICLVINFLVLLFDSNALLMEVDPHSAYWMVAIRCAGFLVVGIALITLSSHRQKLHESHDEILLILTQFPMPVIVSDASGTIQFINDRAGQLLQITPDEAVGLSYFQMLLHENGKGANIQKYVKLVDSTHTESVEINLRARNSSSELLRGILLGIDPKGGRQIITAIV